MKIAGFMKNSFVDFPSYISAVVFTYGCNFDCWYCHNRDIIGLSSLKNPLVEESEVFDFLKTRKGLIDGVVVSGGEPTLQPDLVEFIKKIKDMGFLVKLDTNGTNCEVLKYLLDNHLVDFVAMDVKTSLGKYCNYFRKNVNFDTKNIEKSINLIKNSGVDYEFRTTFAPDVLVEDIEKIGKLIQGAKSYAIQKYRPVSDKVTLMPHNEDVYNEALNTVKKYVPTAFLRGF